MGCRFDSRHYWLEISVYWWMSNDISVGETSAANITLLVCCLFQVPRLPILYLTRFLRKWLCLHLECCENRTKKNPLLCLTSLDYLLIKTCACQILFICQQISSALSIVIDRTPSLLPLLLFLLHQSLCPLPLPICCHAPCFHIIPCNWPEHSIMRYHQFDIYKMSSDRHTHTWYTWLSSDLRLRRFSCWPKHNRAFVSIGSECGFFFRLMRELGMEISGFFYTAK